MIIKKIYIKNYKIFQDFTLNFNQNMNILVGDNEIGKSSILEAINLCLTRRISGRFVDYELSPFLFNRHTTNKYIRQLKAGENPEPPSIIIELYLYPNDKWASFEGNNNSQKSTDCGIKLQISFDEDYKQEYEQLITNDRNKIDLIPVEYYKVQWLSFSNNLITNRGMPINVSFTDSSNIRLQNGADYYLQDTIKNSLEVRDRVGLDISYRQLKEKFCQLDAIQTINNNLSQKAKSISDKQLSISMDLSSKTSWEMHLIPHLNTLPFQLSGQGEQNSLKIMFSLNKNAAESDVILIEEPENHLSFSSMTKLLTRISDTCAGKQIFITTHSTYVLNKLGLGNLILLTENQNLTFENLSNETQDYFMKLSGYDTLRLIIAKKAILVEGPSDELIIQKAYFAKHNKMPIEDGVDVINVRGLSFERFLEIAAPLQKETFVVTDNDGDYEQKVQHKYNSYKQYRNIHICASPNNALPTLEPQLLSVNSLELFNQILNTTFNTEDEMKKFMIDNKTQCALNLFKTELTINFPEYINEAVQ